MANPTILQRELEEVAKWARHAYPTAEEPPDFCSTYCRHSIDRGHYTSGPYAGRSLHVCDIPGLIELEPSIWCDRFEPREN